MYSSTIHSLFYRLVSIQSDTNTLYERIIEEFILAWLKQLPYFKEHEHLCGAFPLEDDIHNRSVIWSLVKGNGPDTVVMIHHHDAVDMEEYGDLHLFATRPDELREALKERKLTDDVKKDLESGEWIFGRGTADMKAGAAIQMEIIKALSEKDFQGNVLMLSVPDEESLSRGMLRAVDLMTQLQKEHNLTYRLTINSEPYFSDVRDKAIFYEGSVGKVMPVIYIKGIKSHIGDPFSGFNSSLILADLQKKTELNVKLSDVQIGEATPPPVWVNLKDRKKAYDASIPEAAAGYFNWLTFDRSPEKIMKQLTSMAKKSLRDTIIHFEDAYEAYCDLIHVEPDVIPLDGQVYTYADLYEMATKNPKPDFFTGYEERVALLKTELQQNLITLPEATTRLMEYVLSKVDIPGPAVIIAISGPYYPHVNNRLLSTSTDFEGLINEIADSYQLTFESRGYFMGISDLSYATFVGNQGDIDLIRDNSPGWDDLYKIPFKALQKLSMPVLNIGPWGKDLHKTTERVLAKDVLERTPYIIEKLIHEFIRKTPQN